jgi:uncharacterized protein (TIGR03435 family)
MSVYELVVAKSGSKLQESKGPRTFFTARPALISGTAVSMRELAAALSGLLDRPATDHTGLMGVYDVKVQWTPDQLRDFKASATFARHAAPDLWRPVRSRRTVDLHGRAGTTRSEIESTKGPVELLVIDHIERPTPD